MKCSLCGREDVPMMQVSVPADDPADEPTDFYVCARDVSIIQVLNGQDKFQILWDILLSALAAMNQMLSADLEYDRDQEPRKTINDLMDQMVAVASQKP